LGLSGLLVIWQLLAVQINLSSWQKASEVVRQTFSQLTPYQIPFAEGDTLYFEGLPDNYQGAYGWRNGLEPAATLLTGHKLGGFFRTPELRVDYRKNEGGRLWFLRYEYDERQANLKLAAIYDTGPEQVIAQANPDLLASWDFTTCDSSGSPGWDWKPGAGQIVCLKGKGLQFDTIGQKTGLSVRSPAFEVAGAKRFYLDLTTYTDFDFEQPQVLAEIRLSEAETGQDLGGFPFDLTADGRSHTYRLYLEPTRPTRALTFTLRANKTRSNILWQRISGSKS